MFDGRLSVRHQLVRRAMRLLLIPLDCALPALQVTLSTQGDTPLDAAERQIAAELLERCVKTGEMLVALAMYLNGRPCRN